MAANLPGTYEDAVEITGTVTMARVDESRLAVLLEDGRSSHQKLWDQIDDLVGSLPPEVISQLPEDGADQHDHYIYGIPKRKL